MVPPADPEQTPSIESPETDTTAGTETTPGTDTTPGETTPGTETTPGETTAGTDEPAGATSAAPAERPPIDVRFSYANERTFLAWNRTALALITAGLAITQLLPPFHVPGGRRMIGMPLIVLGIVLAIASLFQWRRNEEAMHAGKPLPSSPLPAILAVVIGTSAVIAGILAAIGGPE